VVVAHLVDRLTRNFGEKRLTGAVFLDVAKAFVTVWIDGLPYKLMFANFLSYLIHKSHHTSGVQTFGASFLAGTSSRLDVRA